ncbi:hypothetical protein M0R04_14445 [Candidatus Dojkabacteria bacterium]|jgi:hypothetical protein|nr:hypothetical protein [Candidatus Dojkabacteria bacterium]
MNKQKRLKISRIIYSFILDNTDGCFSTATDKQLLAYKPFQDMIELIVGEGKFKCADGCGMNVDLPENEQ